VRGHRVVRERCRPRAAACVGGGHRRCLGRYRADLPVGQCRRVPRDARCRRDSERRSRGSRGLMSSWSRRVPLRGGCTDERTEPWPAAAGRRAARHRGGRHRLGGLGHRRRSGRSSEDSWGRLSGRLRLGRRRSRGRRRCRSRGRSSFRGRRHHRGGNCDGCRRVGRCRRRGLRRCNPRRQEGAWVEVPLRLGGHAHAQVDERRRDLRLAGGADCGDRVALCDRGAPRNRKRAEVRQGDGETGRGLDGDRPARCRHRAGERDGAGRRRVHLGACGSADVDAPMLPARVGVRRVEEERLQDWPIGGPRPRCRWRCEDERGKDRRECERTHRHHSFGQRTRAGRPSVV
jgi:hypothetical protein